MGEVSWLVELAIKPGQLDNFRALTGEMVESTRGEPGALSYERFVSDDGKVVQAYWARRTWGLLVTRRGCAPSCIRTAGCRRGLSSAIQTRRRDSGPSRPLPRRPRILSNSAVTAAVREHVRDLVPAAAR